MMTSEKHSEQEEKTSRMKISSLYHLPAEFAVSDLPGVYFGV